MSLSMVESVIVKRLKEGSREALGLLWQDHSKNVLNLAFRMLKDRDQAEDVMMDIFVQVPKAIQSFQGHSALGTWLYRLTINECLMRIRATKRHGELEEEHTDFIVEEALGKGGNQENSIQDESEEYDPELLELGLDKLPVESRSMLWLKDAEDLDIKDLSEIYKIPEGTIKAKLSRARHYLKNFIKERISHAREA